MRICLSGKRTRASQIIQLNWAIEQKMKKNGLESEFGGGGMCGNLLDYKDP